MELGDPQLCFQLGSGRIQKREVRMFTENERASEEGGRCLVILQSVSYGLLAARCF